jgi:penicillin amidase
MAQPMAHPAAGTPAPGPAPRGGRRRFLRRAGLTLGALLGLLVVTGGGAALWLHDRVEDNLPRVEGELRVAGLTAPATVERDAAGVPTIRAASRPDAAFATGFVHAQDRFFQMDLLRRRAAGELAVVFGDRALGADRILRAHLFRQRAQRVVVASPPAARAVLEAYAAGVNAGLASLEAAPFEYALLRADPSPWRPEDSVLVLISMFVQLSEVNARSESRASFMYDLLPAPLADFLLPAGTEWDAPIDGSTVPVPPLPSPEVVDLRRGPLSREAALRVPPQHGEPRALVAPGSNAWAVAGSRTADGGALLANELHLSLAVPNLWYRAALSWRAGAGEARITGAMLPGFPALIVGSNGKVAWGITNSVLDTSDLVLLQTDPQHPDAYRTPQGWRKLERHRETLHQQDGGTEEISVDWTLWGPVIGKDHRGRLRAVRSVAHLPDGIDLTVSGLETAGSLEEALSIARRSGVPALNFIAADTSGRIGWTILGRLPRRASIDGRRAFSWPDGARGWTGLLPPEEVPAVIDPASGLLWSANNRAVGGDALAKLGGGGVQLGARARQIRDDLLAVERATAEDMRRIQLDDRALFFERWQKLLLHVLTPDAVAAVPRRGELRQVVESWGGRASVDSAGFRMVRTYRNLLAQDVFRALTAPCEEADPEFEYTELSDQFEGPLWRLVSERPLHLLNPEHRTWDEQLLASVDELLALFPEGDLRERTWGERNTLAMSHLLASVLPGFGGWLNMPAQPLPGADHMPRIQDTAFGATLRMVVSPGREAQGFFHMPGGQSGNPLSPAYRAGHDAWAEGTPTPFLPGPVQHRLTLVPGAQEGRR